MGLVCISYVGTDLYRLIYRQIDSVVLHSAYQRQGRGKTDRSLGDSQGLSQSEAGRVTVKQLNSESARVLF
jgi:hypothetical protein